jgi:hypothetical protein
MTQEEYDNAPKVEQILYDKTGMLVKNHTDIIEAMTEYAEGEVKKLNIFSVSQQRELLFDYEKMRTSHVIGATDEWRYSNVDLFMSKL